MDRGWEDGRGGTRYAGVIQRAGRHGFQQNCKCCAALGWGEASGPHFCGSDSVQEGDENWQVLKKWIRRSSRLTTKAIPSSRVQNFNSRQNLNSKLRCYFLSFPSKIGTDFEMAEWSKQRRRKDSSIMKHRQYLDPTGNKSVSGSPRRTIVELITDNKDHFCRKKLSTCLRFKNETACFTFVQLKNSHINFKLLPIRLIKLSICVLLPIRFIIIHGTWWGTCKESRSYQYEK